MCLIIYSPNGKIPKKHLQRGLNHNPDGWGFMFSRNNKLEIRKGMCRNHFWKVWRAENLAGTPVVWHARIGTQGSKTIQNCHPFLLKNHPLAVVHNGIIAQHCEKNCEYNDTQLFVWDVLEHLPKHFLLNSSVRLLLEDYIGASKLVFMDNMGRVEILNEVRGHWLNERWYSNTSYRPKIKEVKPQPLAYTWEDNKPRTKNSLPFFDVPFGGYHR